MFKPNFYQRGVALFLVLGTILIVALLSSVILSIVLNQTRLAYHQITRVKAYYATLAAMNLAVDKLQSGAWGNGLYTFGKCSPNWTGCNDTNDPDIGYKVDINITDGVAPGSHNISLHVNYTYVP